MSQAEYENFVFYGSWKEALDGLEETSGKEIANEFARQIINYGTSGTFTTDNKMIIGFISGMCKALIDKSKIRYGASKDNGSQGGRPTQYNPETIIQLYEEENMTVQEIATHLGCSTKTVERALKTLTT